MSAAPPPSNWWSRKVPPLRTDNAALYAGPHTGRSALMTPATSPKSMPKPRFNLASVLPSFGQRSKKQSPLDIQDPPSHVRSLPSLRSSSQNPRLSRDATSGTSRDSTEGPLTPSDEPDRISYQHSLMTLTDFADPFASESPLDDRRASSHSDKSIGRRLMNKVDGRGKTTSRLPLGATPTPKRKDSRDRSATLPSRVRTASDTYLPLRAAEPQWQPSSPPASPPVKHRPKTSKPALPWPEVQSSSQHCTPSSSLAARLRPDRPDGGRGSVSSTSSVVPLPLSPTSPPSHRSRPSTSSNQTTPTVGSQFSLPPGPPPMQELPPTPGSSTHLRVRAETVASASASAVSFSSSLSSLSFNSRPSPRDSAPTQAYPSHLEDFPGVDMARRGSDSGSSHASSSRAHGLPSPPPPPKHAARPLPSPPAAQRERALSSASSTADGGSIRTLRKQRSFHNTSLHAPAPRTPILRHYSSFEPPVPRSPPPPQDLPPLPVPLTSPRRKLFSSRKHDDPAVSPAAPSTPATAPANSSWYDESAPAAPSSPPLPSSHSDVAQHIVPPAELLRLGAAWERESESLHRAARNARLPPPPRSAGAVLGAAPAWGSRLPRSASLLSKAPRVEPESYTSLSPPPRRARAVTTTRARTSSGVTSESSGSGGARIERKPSFLDMSARRSVSIELPPDPEPGRDSFLELTRGMDSIDTIRESEASFS